MEKFRYGRQTNEKCDNEIGLMPDAEKGCNDVEKILGKHIFGKWANSYWIAPTLLMGAHTIGRAFKENSGYEGAWTTNPGVFDNSYYREILTNGWKPVKVGKGRHQWNTSNAVGTNKLMMLNSDICLAWNHNKPYEKCMKENKFSRRSLKICHRFRKYGKK